MRRSVIKFWHRFYDPSTGRYITADPIGLAGGMNLYAYVGGNPVNYIDPDGLRRFFLPYHPSIETEIDVWEETLSPYNLKVMAKKAGKCLTCTVTCSGVAIIGSNTQDALVNQTVKAAKKKAKRKAAQIAASWLAKGHPVYKLISGIQVGRDVYNCVVDCQPNE